ncbi:MAG TPA: hypothetical protein VF809_01855, partial [Candidatus Saccharimonadales bacterium]
MPKTPAADKKPVKEPRKLNTGEYKSFRLQKKIKTGDNNIPGSWSLFRGACSVLRSNWKTFLGIMIVYGLLNMILVQSFSDQDLAKTKENLDGMSGGQWSSLVSGLSLFIYMAASSGNLSSDVAGAYQLILTITASLALIWALRQTYAQKKTTVRMAFYRGMYPLVPFVSVLLAATMQLVPVVTGGFLYNMVTGNGIAVTGAETLIWGFVFFLLALVSFYLLTASIMALYIVCLPDMTPMLALRSARDLVKYRRWTVMRRVLF